MRIVTWNIELGKDLDLAAQELSEHPALESADVVLLQEMSPAGTEQLAERLGMAFHFDAAAPHPLTRTPFGNAILSRWPLGEPEHVLLPHTAPVQGQPRSALLSTVTLDGVDVLVASVHLETVLLDLRRRRRQLGPLAVVLDRHRQPCVVGGDFNSASVRSRRAFEAILSRAELERISPDDPTFHRFGRPYVLDHLFGRGVDVVDTGVVGRARASDHDPVWAEVRITAPEVVVPIGPVTSPQ